MGVFSEYHEYITNNPEGYWFKRKLYGIGWTPATWHGWVVTGVYLLFVFGLVTASSYQLISDPNELLWPIVGATLLFLAITWKTGEPLKWQWGRERSK